MRETVIQFGEGNFLRAFFDAFIDELNKRGLYDGKAVIVKPTPRGNLDKFNKQSCVYNLVIRGIENEKSVYEQREINSVSRCVNPYEDYDAYLALAQNPDFRFIVSNTTEAGITFDESCKLDDRPALSFPGKLTQLLYERYRLNLKGFIILPCELIDENADKLKECVFKYAELWGLEEDFTRWLNSENSFCNTLVDRIVTGYPESDAERIFEEIGHRDALLDTAEPYHLWAIEGDFENELPLCEAGFNAVWTDDIKPYKKRKVRILNGAHTSMVFPALLCGINTVDEAVNDKDVSAFLMHFLNECAIPVADNQSEYKAFANDVIQRFKNPFIRHQLRAIALNSVSKFNVRVLPTAKDYKDRFGFFPRCAAFSLAALIAFYKNDSPTDSDELVSFIKSSSVCEIVLSDIWECDISGMLDDVKASYEYINKGKIREGMQWAIS